MNCDNKVKSYRADHSSGHLWKLPNHKGKRVIVAQQRKSGPIDEVAFPMYISTVNRNYIGTSKSETVEAAFVKVPAAMTVSIERRPVQCCGGRMERERRRTPRYIFIASAELYEEQSDVRVASRVSELSLHGCYLDMMNPFPPGTIILLKIFAGDLTFQSKARVIYATQNMGAGVAFLDVEEKYKYILERWMEQAATH
jgi:hypothetical protein